MSKRFAVALAVKAMVDAALPAFSVLGLTADDAKASRVGPDGRAMVHQGDPGEPDVDLSPLAYNYSHPVPVELEARDAATLDAAMVAIGAAIEANRTLGGLCNWLEAQAPEVDNYTTPGAVAVAGTTLNIVATYATPNPLT